MRYVLCVDGGGIRGAGSAQILLHIDRALKAAGKRPAADLFDLHVGTSTGSIVAAALAASTHPSAAAFRDPQKIVEIYRRRGGEIFNRNPLSGLFRNMFRQKYASAPLAGILKEVLGDLTLGQLEKNFLATFYSMRPGDPRTVFAHGGPAYPRVPEGRYYGQILVREAVLASCSAPTYFNPADVSDPGGLSGQTNFVAIDGGVFANNPALCAYVEAQKIFPDQPLVVVSIGSGRSKTNYPPAIKTWGIFEWISPRQGVPLLKAVMHGQSDSAEHQLEFLLGSAEPPAYFRFQFDLSEISKEMDDASPANLDRLIASADACMASAPAKTALAALVARC